MLFQQLTRTDGEKVFIICRNISAATQSAGAALYFDDVEVSDGNAVSGCRTSHKWHFAGINAQALSDDSYGLVQVYGVASAYLVLAASASAAASGEQFNAVTSQIYLKQYASTDVFTAVSSAVWAGGDPWNFVTLMEAFASAASATSSASLKQVFVRAM